MFLKGIQRPYVVWDVPHKRLKRTLSCEFITDRRNQQIIPQIFRNELEALRDDEKLGVVCATQTAAKGYARYCAERGKTYVLYHGGVSASKKRGDFQDPDAAWDDVQVVIYNLCVTVGVDPKRTRFKSLFMHCSYGGGNWLAMFQAVKRFNRHLTDEFVIHVVLTCKRPEEQALESYTNASVAAARRAPTLSTALAQVTAQHRNFQAHCRKALTEAGQSFADISQAPGWLDAVRAHVTLTDLKHSCKETHYAEFRRMAEASGWRVEFKRAVAAAELAEVIGLDLTEEQQQELDGAAGLAAHLASQGRDYIEEFRDAADTITDAVPARERTVFHNDALQLFFNMYNLRGDGIDALFGDATSVPDAYKQLDRRFGDITRYVNAAYRSERDVLLCESLKLNQGRHPLMARKSWTTARHTTRGPSSSTPWSAAAVTAPSARRMRCWTCSTATSGANC